ncbi:MAG: sigma-70 family RNA polymerase sigma factor [Clostridia bacterium]|nr:sigma-70 family RNA polymerase sigma factor [Clostridia bacterium]
MEREQLVKLVTAAQNGDSGALNELFNAFYNDVYYFALKTVKDGDLACDITQEAFVEIINTIHNLKEPAAFVTWMKQITYHQCTRYFKKKKDVLVDENEDGETIFDTVKEENSDFIPDEALDKDDFKNTILKILDELSEEQRSATMMYYFDELSVKQIAEIQGVSEGTVKSRLNYARKSIKASVEAYEKKNGIKLHAFPFFPLISWIFKGGIEALPFASAETVAGGVSAATGAAISATAGSTAATATATAATTTAATTATVTTTATTTATTTVATTAATATGIGAKIVALPLVTKIIAGVTAAVIAVGGGTTAVLVANDNDGDNDNQPSSSYVDGYGGPSSETLTVLEGIIPDMCTYTMYDGTVLTAGQPFPETCTKGDKVEYGDYYYGYECIFIRDIEGGGEYSEDWITLDESFDTGDSGVTLEDILGCWTPCVIDRTQESYGSIVTSINGKTINNLFCTFQNCKNMKTAPAIPETVTSISMAYYRCDRLNTAPVIPKSVKRLSGAFWDTSVSGEVVINGKLDKSTRWYYEYVFNNTYTEINLTGEMAEEELFMIAEGSNNPQITVNGKPVVFYYDTNRLTNGMSHVKQLAVNTKTFFDEEPAAGYGGDYESGEECSAIYSAHAIADHFHQFDVFGYNINVEEFMILNTAMGDVYYTFTKDDKMTSDFQVQYSLYLNFRTKDEILTQLKRDVAIFEKLVPNFDFYLQDKSYNIENITTITDDTYNKIAKGDGWALDMFNYDTSNTLGLKLNAQLGCDLVDGHYVYRVSFNLRAPSELLIS